MIKIIRLIVLILVFGYSKNVQAQAKMHFIERKVDFGAIKEGRILNYKFSFVNTGDKPIIINEIQQGCGCVATNYPIRPIMPSDTAAIYTKMITNGKKGRQNQRILIFSNAENSPVELRLKCVIKN